MNYFFHVLFLLLSTDFILVCVLGTEVVILSPGVLHYTYIELEIWLSMSFLL